MSDVKWMTYAELAAALGIGGDSARNLARRKRWSRKPGNDGLARIGVPAEHLEHRKLEPVSPPTDGPTDPPASPPIDPPTVGGSFTLSTTSSNALKKKSQSSARSATSNVPRRPT